MRPRKEFRALLDRKKLKKTSQREFIWEILMESKGHPSVEEIRDQLMAKGHRIGMLPNARCWFRIVTGKCD